MSTLEAEAQKLHLRVLFKTKYINSLMSEIEKRKTIFQ